MSCKPFDFDLLVFDLPLESIDQFLTYYLRLCNVKIFLQGWLLLAFFLSGLLSTLYSRDFFSFSLCLECHFVRFY